MPLSDMVVRSKLVAPRPLKAIFHRARLQAKLTASLDYPLTLVCASTGFGKTTALLELSGLYNHTYWYNITEPDRDPTLFLAHLISALQPASSGLIKRLEEGGGQAVSAAILTGLINQLTTDLEEEAVLILDDYHLVSDVADINAWLEQLVEQRPPKLHIAISCRQVPETPDFIRWRVKGDLLLIGQGELAFTAPEIFALFSDHYHFPISEEQGQTLFNYTGGWIIGLQMIWQRLQTSHSKRLDAILSALPTALSDVFSFLAQEVLMRQPAEVQAFLLSSAVLRQMDAESCDHLLGIHSSHAILQQLADQGLFIYSDDRGSYRYQRLFQDFLIDQANNRPDVLQDLHRKAAEYFTNTGNYEEAVYHRFCHGDMAEAARLIEKIGPHLLDIGRLRTLTSWIEQLDQAQLEQRPALNLLMGDVLRLDSKFEAAIGRYDAAEKIFLLNHDALGRSQALRSKAQVYLDTIRPLKASSLLEEAVGLLEPQEHPAEVAALLDQLAENKLNLGKPEEAQALHKEASMLRSESDPDDIYLEARALLRTGRLHAARALLESSAALDEDLSTGRPQRFHREMSLLLALICLMSGDATRGEQYSQQGIRLGQQLVSPFVEAVGLMRLGHAYQLYPQTPWRRSRLQKSEECYEKAIRLVKPFNVMRVQVEPLWGLCRLYGYQGRISDAKRLADQAIEIARSSGDWWFVALLNTTLGTAYTLTGERDNAEMALHEAIDGFEQVGDRFGLAAAQTARILNLWLQGSIREALAGLSELVPLLRDNDFSFLLTRSSHLGVQDPQIFLPLLIEAQRQGLEREWIDGILRPLNLDTVDFHPGYGLNIRAFGGCEVWRGTRPVQPREWQREKARQLLQFFVSGKGKWYSREQICDRLWPQLDAENADQNLKVALNALSRALEPAREPGKAPFFIARRDASYGFNPAASIAIDVDDFLELANSQDEEDLSEALSIYQGDYLAENLGDSWAREKREKLQEIYLQTALKLASLLAADERLDDAIRIAHQILETDHCSEPAFQLLMNCHAARGNRAAVNSVYRRCAAALREELEVKPSPETTRLWQRLTKEG